jgi:hypothetical protein
MPVALEIICKNCGALSGVPRLEKTVDGLFFARCENCRAKNQVVQTGVTASQPGVLPVIGLIR